MGAEKNSKGGKGMEGQKQMKTETNNDETKMKTREAQKLPRKRNRVGTCTHVSIA